MGVLGKYSLRSDFLYAEAYNIDALNAQTGPVLSVYRANADVKAILDSAKTEPPIVDVVGQHDVTHTLWRIDDETTVTALTDAFEAMDAIYIADGHHRSAAASRVSAERGSPAFGSPLSGDPEDGASPLTWRSYQSRKRW